MPPLPSPFRVLAPRLRLALLFAAAGPLPGAAQATGGFTTSSRWPPRPPSAPSPCRSIRRRATPAATSRRSPLHPALLLARSERRLLREQFGIEEPGRLYLSDTIDRGVPQLRHRARPGRRAAGALLPGGRAVRAAAPARPGRSSSDGWRRLRPDDFPASARMADTSLASLDPEARPAFERMLAAARRGRPPGAGGGDPSHRRAPGLPDGVGRRSHLHRHLEALLGPRGGPDRRRRQPAKQRAPGRGGSPSADGSPVTRAGGSG